MLPAKIAQIIRDQFAVALPANLNEAFRKVFQSAAEQAVRNGTEGSSRHAAILAMQLQKFYREQIEAAFYAMERVMLETRPPYYAELKNDLVETVRTATMLLHSEMGKNLEVATKAFGGPGRPTWAEYGVTVDQWLKAECSLLAGKLDTLTSERHPTMEVHYNLSGANARVNINSQDYSINIENSGQIFELLRNLTRDSVEDENDRSKIESGINELEREIRKPGFKGAYFRFMAIVADHMQVFGPIMPALAKLLEESLK